MDDAVYVKLIEQAPDPIITLDRAGTMLFMNSAAEQACGHAAAELVGKHFIQSGVLTAGGIVKATQEFALVVLGQERPPFELQILRADGVTLLFEAHPKLIAMRNTSAAAVQVIFRDVTQRKRAEDALAQQRAEAEQLNRVMLEREDRILELKREVNALLRKLHEPPKYQA